MISNAKSALGRLKRKVFRTNSAFWFCRDMEQCPIVPGSAISEMCFNDLDRSIGYIMEKAREFPWILVQGELEAARQWSHFYPLIYHSGDVAGYIKIALGKAYVEDFDDLISLRDDEAFICDTFIDPKFRGKGMSKMLLGESISWLRSRGIRYIFCHIPGWNTASLNLYQQFGFRKLHKIRHFRVIGLRCYTCLPEKTLADGRRINGMTW